MREIFFLSFLFVLIGACLISFLLMKETNRKVSCYVALYQKKEEPDKEAEEKIKQLKKIKHISGIESLFPSKRAVDDFLEYAENNQGECRESSCSKYSFYDLVKKWAWLKFGIWITISAFVLSLIYLKTL